jgi:hypothetical protein
MLTTFKASSPIRLLGLACRLNRQVLQRQISQVMMHPCEGSQAAADRVRQEPSARAGATLEPLGVMFPSVVLDELSRSPR